MIPVRGKGQLRWGSVARTPNRWPVKLERLFSLLAGIHPLSDDFKAAIARELTVLSLPKRHFLLEAPRVCEHAWFLDSGFAMSYSYADQAVHVENFWAAGEIVLSVKSFFDQVPATEFVQLMTPADVIFVSYAGVQRLFRDYREAHFIYETVVNRYYERSRERAHDMRYLGAMERYEKLLARHPLIEQTVPLEYIAAYLGIVPQSLSRLRKKRRES